MTTKQYRWSTQVYHLDEAIKSSYDPLQEWHPDPKGYFLIKIDPKKKLIEVGYVTYKHEIKKVITGKYASEVYTTIIRHNLISRLEHSAYLGKELYKAEIALKYGIEYKQEFPLNFKNLKPKVKLKQES